MSENAQVSASPSQAASTTSNSTDTAPVNLPNQQSNGTAETKTTQVQNSQANESGGSSEKVNQSIREIYQRQQQELIRKQQEANQLKSQSFQGDSLTSPINQQPYHAPEQGKFNPQEYMNQLLPKPLTSPQEPQYVQPQVAPEIAQLGVNWDLGFPRFMDGTLVPPPNETDPGYDDFLQWTLENPHHYIRYQQEMSKQAYRQEVEAYQRQQQELLQQQEYERQQEQEFNGYITSLKEELATNYHPVFAENEDAFDALYECIEQIAPFLPTDENGRFYNVAENRPMTEKDLVNIGFTRLKEYYDILNPVFSQIGKIQGVPPANQLMSSGSQIASNLQQPTDLGEQIKQARATGNNELARQLMRRQMFPHLYNQA